MAIKITEDGAVRYVNENDVDRTMFPNLTGAMGDEQYDALNGRLTVVEGKVSDLEECCGDVNNDITELKNDLTQLEDKVEDAYNAYVVETETGSIASFSDGADDVPVKDLTVAIEPVQDLHGQSSPYPAGGGVNTIDSSKFVSYGTSYGLTTSFDGDWIIISGTYTGSSQNANFRFLVMSDGSEFPAPANMKCFPDSASANHFTDGSLGRADDNKTLTIFLTNMITDTVYNLRFRVMGYEGSTAPDSYSPYSNICPISGWTGANVYHSGEDTSDYDTLSISWETEAGTVYGGTLDVTTGVLTVTDANIASYNGETLPSTWISDRDIYVEGTTPTTGAQVVYKLATPQTYQLTPTEVKTLLGQNNIWADTGNVSLEYRADTKLYIDKVLNA